MKNLCLLVTVLIIFSSLFCEEKELQYGLGFSGGLISGSGFSFRKLNADFGYQINLGALMDNSTRCDECFAEELPGDWYYEDDDIYTEHSYGSSFHANLGVNLYKQLHQSRKSRFYLLAGTAAYLFSEEVSEQDYSYDDTDSVWVKTGQVRHEQNNDFTLNLGAGFGIEYKLSENIRLNLEWPLTFSFSDGDMNIYMYIPQGGIHYFFK